MKTIIMAVAILLAANTGAFAQDSTHKHANHQHSSAKGQKYTCTMHPEVVRSKPGKCPKCGMKLVAMKSKKTTKKMADMKMDK